MTVNEALDKINEIVIDSELPIGIWENIKDATDYLGEKMSLTPIECCIVAQLMDHYTKEMSEEEICYYLDWEAGDVRCATEEMRRLTECGFVYPVAPVRRKGREQPYYIASDALIYAYWRDCALTAPWDFGHKTYEFWAGVGMVFCTLKSCEIKVDAVFYALRNLITNNSHLKCCKHLDELNLDDGDLSFLLFVVSEYLIKGCEELEQDDCRDVIHGDVVERIVSQFEESTSELLKKNLIQCRWDEGCNFSLTEHTKQLLFDDDCIFGLLDDDCAVAEENDDKQTDLTAAQLDKEVVYFWRDIEDLLLYRSNYEINYGEMEREFMNLVQSCQHIDCCKRLTELNLNCIDFVFLVVLCSKYIDCMWENKPLNMYYNLVPFQCIDLIVRQFKDKTSDLLRKDLVRMSNDFATVSLTDNAKNLFVDPELMIYYG